jgi:hypothetical protein
MPIVVKVVVNSCSSSRYTDAYRTVAVVAVIVAVARSARSSNAVLAACMSYAMAASSSSDNAAFYIRQQL